MVDTNECMLYAGYKSGGYGRICVKRNGKTVLRGLHREVYEAKYGVVSKDLVMDHLCRNRSCFNTDHLEPVTNEENLNRGERHRTWGTHCSGGHLVTPTSYRVKQSGSRICLQCARDYINRVRAERRLTAAPH